MPLPATSTFAATTYVVVNHRPGLPADGLNPVSKEGHGWVPRSEGVGVRDKYEMKAHGVC